MISEGEFVERSVQHQIGDLSAVSLAMCEETIERAKSVSSGMALQWDHAIGAPDPYNGWIAPDGILRKTGNKVNREKVNGALTGILQFKPEFSFFVDMADHRARSLVTEGNRAAPVFCFNRRTKASQGRILWPLAGYQDHASPEFLGESSLRDIPWDEKEGMVVWRGSAGGWARLGKYGRGGMIRMHALLGRYARGDIGLEDTERALMTIPRHRFVVEAQSNPAFDVGYTHFGGHDFDSMPLVGEFKRSRVNRTDFGRFKYLAVLPGADIGSNFYWVMNSSSLGLVVTPEFDSFASAHFKPWEHYVPVRSDLGDLDTNLRWCEDNQEKCQAMVRRANEVCDLLADGELRRRILGEVVARVGAHLAAVEGAG